MTIDIFDKKLLEFMYFLTRQNKFMNSQQISKVLTINGKKVTDRTVRRWFTLLKHNRNFNYFLSSKQTQIALTPTWVFVKNILNFKVFDVIPYRTYLVNGVCLKTLQKACLSQFCIPYHSTKNFEKFWAHAKKKRLIGSYQIFHHKPSVSLYHPLHKSLSREGQIKNCNEPMSTYFLDLLNKTVADKETKMHPHINKNPILVPMLCELFGEHFSSSKLWDNLRLKLGSKVWDYLPSKLQNDEAAVLKHLQHLLKEVYAPEHGYIQQLRVSYTPIYLNNLGLYTFLKLKDPHTLSDFTKEAVKYSIHTVVSPSVSPNGTHIIYSVMNQDMLGQFMELVSTFAKNHGTCNIFLQNLKRADVTYSKIDYFRCFDPETCSWEYDYKGYIRQLEDLAKNP